MFRQCDWAPCRFGTAGLPRDIFPHHSVPTVLSGRLALSEVARRRKLDLSPRSRKLCWTISPNSHINGIPFISYSDELREGGHILIRGRLNRSTTRRATDFIGEASGISGSSRARSASFSGLSLIGDCPLNWSRLQSRTQELTTDLGPRPPLGADVRRRFGEAYNFAQRQAEQDAEERKLPQHVVVVRGRTGQKRSDAAEDI